MSVESTKKKLCVRCGKPRPKSSFKYCDECGVIVGKEKNAKRCKRYHVSRERKINNHCVDCGKGIGGRAKRCHSCATTSFRIGKKFRPFSQEHRDSISRSELSGENNPNWKGENICYKYIHKWVRKHKPKPLDLSCEICGQVEKLELSNISGEYHRDINDFQWSCRKCNRKHDRELREIKIILN